MFKKIRNTTAGILLLYQLFTSNINAQNNNFRLSDTEIGLKTKPVVLNVENNFGMFKESELVNIQGYLALKATDSTNVYGAKTGLTNHRYGGSIDSRVISLLTGYLEKHKILFGSTIDYSYNNKEDTKGSTTIMGPDTLYANTRILRNEKLSSKKVYASFKDFGIEYVLHNIKDNTDVRTLIKYQGSESVSVQNIDINWTTEIYSLKLTNYLKLKMLNNTIKADEISEHARGYVINLNIPKILLMNGRTSINAYGFGYVNTKMSSWDIALRLRQRQNVGIGINFGLTYMQNMQQLHRKSKMLDLTISTDDFVRIDNYELEKNITDSLSYVKTSQSMNNLMHMFYADDPLVGNPIKFRIKFSSEKPEITLGVDLSRLIKTVPIFIIYNNNDQGIFNNNTAYKNKHTLSLGIKETNLYAGMRTTLVNPKEYKIFAGYIF